MGKILVVGGAGYIGSHVVLEFLEAGHNVHVYDNLFSGSRENLFAEAEFIFGDILDKEKLKEVLKNNYDAIIHLASRKAAGESMEKPEEYQYWKSDDEIWLLGRTTGETALLIHQDLKASFSLPKPTPPSERGKPISLEDIGIGKLDLDATQPNIDLPDTDHFEDGGPTNSSKK